MENKLFLLALEKDAERQRLLSQAVLSASSSYILQYCENKRDILEEIASKKPDLLFIDYFDKIKSSEWGDGINILLVGSDKKKFDFKKSRSDVIIILRINKYGKIKSEKENE